MKIVIILIAMSLFLSSCATVLHSPVIGVLYTNTVAPLAVTSDAESTKVGKAEAKNILGLFATGDASIEQAKKNGDITKVHHVDFQSKIILGIVAKYTVIVYGE